MWTSSKGLGYHDIVGKIPKTIDVACHNSSTSCTISGPTADVEQFVGDLKAGGVFAKSVNVANIAYHSRYIQPAAPVLLKYLREVSFELVLLTVIPSLLPAGQ